jgi:hypothetical protein
VALVLVVLLVLVVDDALELPPQADMEIAAATAINATNRPRCMPCKRFKALGPFMFSNCSGVLNRINRHRTAN